MRGGGVVGCGTAAVAGGGNVTRRDVVLAVPEIPLALVVGTVVPTGEYDYLGGYHHGMHWCGRAVVSWGCTFHYPPTQSGELKPKDHCYYHYCYYYSRTQWEAVRNVGVGGWTRRRCGRDNDGDCGWMHKAEGAVADHHHQYDYCSYLVG